MNPSNRATLRCKFLFISLKGAGTITLLWMEMILLILNKITCFFHDQIFPAHSHSVKIKFNIGDMMKISMLIGILILSRHKVSKSITFKIYCIYKIGYEIEVFLLIMDTTVKFS